LYAIARGPQQELGRDRRLSSSDGWYLDALVLHTRVDGTLRISLRELAKELSRSISTVRYHVKRLIELGFVEDLGACAEDGRHRVWRIAGMDRPDKVKKGPGDNHGPGSSRSREVCLARPPLESREVYLARVRAELPGELIETTRASTQQEPARPWEGAPRGIQASREALARRRSLTGGCDAPGGVSEASDDGREPPAALGAQNSAEGSVGSPPGGAPRSVADGASRCGDERDVLPSCSTMNPNPDDYEPEVPDEEITPPEPFP